MLFQMCYGPEIRSIFECVLIEPGITNLELKKRYQFQENGDIQSLIDSTIEFLKDLELIEQSAGLNYAKMPFWKNIYFFKRLNEELRSENIDSLNMVFVSMYNELFVKPDRLFIGNLHYQVNNTYSNNVIGHEKINAWKRIMECYGLGRRVYSGFYALPRLDLIIEIIDEVGKWEGPLHQFCINYIDPIVPCVTSKGNIYKGVIFSIIELNRRQRVRISNKQDLPYKAYGENYEFNWILTYEEGADNIATMY